MKNNYPRKSRLKRVSNFLRRELRWFLPGLGVKRWLLLILAGVTLVAVGFAYFLLDIYRTAPENWFLPVISTLALRFLDRPLRIIIFGSAGLGFIIWGIWGLNKTLLKPFMKPGKHVLDTVTAYRKRERGPRVVAIGGGNGLSTLLRGLKHHTNNITAIVTVADDGGSSGELRKSVGILPPGDIRNCLAALSDDEELLSQIFQYRFGSAVSKDGHAFGNLFITALTDITGSFEEAVAESSRVLATRGRVLPATLHDVRLIAEIDLPQEQKQVQVRGESQITNSNGKIKRVWLEPNNPLAFPPAIQALLSADLILVGPGSLFTSLLPNLLVHDLADALKMSKALKFYVCNVATQHGETDGFSAYEHVRVVEKYLHQNIFDLVVCNNANGLPLPEGIKWVTPDDKLHDNYAVYCSDLIDTQYPWRHDSTKLAQTIMDLFYERTGPMMYKEGLEVSTQ